MKQRLPQPSSIYGTRSARLSTVATPAVAAPAPDSGNVTGSECRLYLLIPRDLGHQLYEPLRMYFSVRPEVEVIVDRRARPRPRIRLDATIAVASGESPSRREGRVRFTRRRVARAVAVDASELPEAIRQRSSRLVLIDCAGRSEREAEDCDAARLVDRALTGDGDAFAFIHMRYYARIHDYVRNKVGAGDASDLTQEVFVRAFEALVSYRARGPFRAWLFLIARNASVDHLRKRGRVELLAPHAVDGLSEKLHGIRIPEADGRLANGNLGSVIAQLPDMARTVVVLRYELGFALREVALIVGVSEKAVYHHHERALATLRNGSSWRRQLIASAGGRA
jgi:RNA polymerase sigma-70 factor (ECF subfamily)